MSAVTPESKAKTKSKPKAEPAAKASKPGPPVSQGQAAAKPVARQKAVRNVEIEGAPPRQPDAKPVKALAAKKEVKAGSKRVRSASPAQAAKTKVGKARILELPPKKEPASEGPSGKTRTAAASAAKVPTKTAPASGSAPTPELKATRKRAPKDLAQQYGENTAKRAPKKEPAVARRKRMKADERERLREMMAPSDELMERLARTGSITTTVVGMADDNDFDDGPDDKPKSTRRSRKWESRCGKCGTVGQFTSAAGVCAKCGAIAVRL